jgi:hypothetical protein
MEDVSAKKALGELNPTALRNLFSAANEASCLEEVLILLRYQQGRDPRQWPEALVNGIVTRMEQAVKNAGLDSRLAADGDRDRAASLIAARFLSSVVRLQRYLHEAGQGGRR